MNIGVNLRYLQKNITGIERSILEIIKELSELPGDHCIKGYITSRPFVSYNAEDTLRNLRKVSLNSKRLCLDNITSRLLWDIFGVGAAANADCVNLFWGPSFSLPLHLNSPSVVSIYDLAYMHYPKAYNIVTRLFHSIVTRLSAHRANAIVTISESSKKDIVNKLGIPASRVFPVTLACGREFHRFEPSVNNHLQLKKFGINTPFWLSVSQISPRKNLSHLVRVFSWLKRERTIPHQLVLAGSNGWKYKEVYETVRREKMENHIVFTGRVSDSELVCLYNYAELFIFPSLFEGFGLPVLEAMACGCPVIAANSSSLPEVVGEAGILIPPTDERALAEALIGLYENPSCKEAYRQLGYKRAAEFTWARSAHSILDVFQKVILENSY